MAGQTLKAKTSRGCPQGGVLSPLLWCLVVDDLITRLNRASIYAQAYADDVAILIRGKFFNTLCELTNGALGIVERWCAENSLSVNPAKTVLVPFTNKRNLGRHGRITMFGADLALSEKAKYLGLILDKKLTWSEHITTKCTKARLAFWACSRAIGRTWGLAPKSVRWLYTGIVRPALSYGSVV